MTVQFGLVAHSAHGPALKNKYNSTKSPDLLKVIEAYEKFVSKAGGISFELSDDDSIKEAVKQLTVAVNEYRNIALPILESRKNAGQENLRSSILEEFFQILVYPLISTFYSKYSDSLVLGKANSYVSMTFTPRSFENLFTDPTPQIHTKDQDFVLGCTINIGTWPIGVSKLNEVKVIQAVIPVIAIECKTYIERNMLDSCSGTARRLKHAMPYCLYIVASEYMKMECAYPELSDIDELFVLTRATNSERAEKQRKKEKPHELGEDLIIDIFFMILKHLEKIWWAPDKALSRGRIIGRP